MLGKKVLHFKKKSFDVVGFARKKLKESGIDTSKYFDSDDSYDFCPKCNIELYDWYKYCPKCGKKLAGKD